MERSRLETADLRHNAYPGVCSDCGREVTKMAGYLGPKVAGAWTVHHKGCTPAVAPRKQVRARAYGRSYGSPVKGTGYLCTGCGNPGYDCDC